MCLERIGVYDVIEALARQVARAGSPLEVDTDTITDDLIVRNAARYEHAVEAHKFAWAALYE